MDSIVALFAKTQGKGPLFYLNIDFDKNDLAKLLFGVKNDVLNEKGISLSISNFTILHDESREDTGVSINMEITNKIA